MFPFLQIFGALAEKLLAFEAGAQKLQAKGDAKSLFFGFIFGSEDLKDGIKGDHKPFFDCPIVWSMIEDGLIGEDKCDWRGVLFVEEIVGGENGVGGIKLFVFFKKLAFVYETHLLSNSRL